MIELLLRFALRFNNASAYSKQQIVVVYEYEFMYHRQTIKPLHSVMWVYTNNFTVNY